MVLTDISRWPSSDLARGMVLGRGYSMSLLIAILIIAQNGWDGWLYALAVVLYCIKKYFWFWEIGKQGTAFNNLSMQLTRFRMRR